MKLNLDKNTLSKALQSIQGILGKHVGMPILNHVLISSLPDYIQLTATDLEVSIQTKCQATVIESGLIALPGKKLFEIVRDLPDQPIELETTENDWAKLSCGNFDFQIVGLPGDDYPSLPEFDPDALLPFEPAELRNMITKVIYSISDEGTRFAINGALFETDEELFKMVATDGFRLSLTQQKLPQKHEPPVKEILPKKALHELLRFLDTSDETLMLGFQSNHGIFKTGERLLTCRLLEGKFPNYTTVIPQKKGTQVVLPREDFLNALKRVSLLFGERSKPIKLTFAENKLSLSGENPEIGKGFGSFPVNYEAESFEVGFNAVFLLDIMQSLNSEEVRLYLDEPDKPLLIEIPDDDRHIFVVMPMKV